jgi:hypothetical protein
VAIRERVFVMPREDLRAEALTLHADAADKATGWRRAAIDRLLEPQLKKLDSDEEARP